MVRVQQVLREGSHDPLTDGQAGASVWRPALPRDGPEEEMQGPQVFERLPRQRQEEEAGSFREEESKTKQGVCGGGNLRSRII